MRFTPQQKLIAASIVSVLTLGACLWAFWFIASGIARDDSARAEISARLEGFAQDRVRAREFSAVRAERRGDIARIAGFFIDRARPIDFLHTLEDIGRITGAVVSIEVDPAGTDREYLGFRVTVEGNGLARMVRYIRLLERLPYIITVSQISEDQKSPDARAQSGPSDRLVVSLRVRTK